MTNGERTAVGVGLGIIALALLPRDAREALGQVVMQIMDAAMEQVRRQKAFAEGEEIWEEIDVSDLTVH